MHIAGPHPQVGGQQPAFLTNSIAASAAGRFQSTLWERLLRVTSPSCSLRVGVSHSSVFSHYVLIICHMIPTASQLTPPNPSCTLLPKGTIANTNLTTSVSCLEMLPWLPIVLRIKSKLFNMILKAPDSACLFSLYLCLWPLHTPTSPNLNKTNFRCGLLR